jgi:hypothetical protein
VRLIQLGSEDDVKAPKGAANERFRKFVQTLNLFRGAATTIDGLVEAAKQTVLHVFADLVGLGGREARQGRFYTGDALNGGSLTSLTASKRLGTSYWSTWLEQALRILATTWSPTRWRVRRSCLL